MSKTIDEVTQDELESLYLENNLDVKKIAKILGCNVRELRTKFKSYYNNKEDFLRLIRVFSLNNYMKFRDTFPYLLRKANSLGIKARELFLNTSLRDLSEYKKDIEKTRNYILNELKCKNAREIQKKDPSFALNVWRYLDINDKLFIFPNLRQTINHLNYIKRFNSVFEAVLNYVKENNIKNTIELHKNSTQMYRYFLSLTPEEKELIFPGCTSGSGWEIRMKESLQKEFSDCTIIAQKTFDDCKNSRLLPFDLALYSPSGNLIALIEIHGKTHFTKVYNSIERNRFENIRKRDILKYEYCKKNNIPLFYFTYEPSLIEKYGYPYPIHTDFEELVKAIRELLQKVS